MVKKKNSLLESIEMINKITERFEQQNQIATRFENLFKPVQADFGVPGLNTMVVDVIAQQQRLSNLGTQFALSQSVDLGTYGALSELAEATYKYSDLWNVGEYGTYGVLGELTEAAAVAHKYRDLGNLVTFGQGTLDFMATASSLKGLFNTPLYQKVLETIKVGLDYKEDEGIAGLFDFLENEIRVNEEESVEIEELTEPAKIEVIEAFGSIINIVNNTGTLIINVHQVEEVKGILSNLKKKNPVAHFLIINILMVALVTPFFEGFFKPVRTAVSDLGVKVWQNATTASKMIMRLDLYETEKYNIIDNVKLYFKIRFLDENGVEHEGYVSKKAFNQTHRVYNGGSIEKLETNVEQTE